MTARLLFLLLILALPAAPSGAQEAAAPPPGVQVLTHAEIRQAGVTRLTDLFDLLDGWYAHSTDGYHWHASAGGLAPPEAPRWRVVLDGLPLDFTAFGQTNLNLFPVSVAALDSVVAVRAPDFRDGVAAPAGVLHLYTRRPAPGVGVEGGIGAGNEVNDPGPYRYTPHASPNIDRSGPRIEVDGLAGAPGWAGRLGVATDEFHATDERIARRVYLRYREPYNPRFQLRAAHLAAATGPADRRHRLLLAAARLQDFLFWAPFGAELPVSQRVATAAVQGLRLEGPAALRYRAVFIRHDVGPRANRDTVDADFLQDRLDAGLELGIGTPERQLSLGAGAAYTRTSTALPLSDPSLVVTYAQVHARRHPSGGGARHDVALKMTHAYDRVGLQAYTSSSYRPLPGHLLTARLALVRQTTEERHDVWYWTTKGYGLPAPLETISPRLPYRPLSTTASVDLGWAHTPSAAVALEAALLYRRYWGQYTPVYRFHPAGDDFDVETSLAVGVAGQVLGAEGSVRLRGPGPLRHRLHYRYLRPQWSNPAFYASWSMHPWHQGSYTVHYNPTPRFGLFGRLRYLGETRWEAFRAAGDARYPSTLPAYWLLDVTAQKRFWQDHLAVSVSVRNLLNAPYRSHPAGVVTNMMFTFNLVFFFQTTASG